MQVTQEEGAIKEWIFAERGREYLGGWLTVLEAMQEAIKYADKKAESASKG